MQEIEVDISVDGFGARDDGISYSDSYSLISLVRMLRACFSVANKLCLLNERLAYIHFLLIFQCVGQHFGEILILLGGVEES